MIEGLLSNGRGFRFPKKADGLCARDVGRPLGVDTGLEIALGPPLGRKALAAGLGLNSAALMLNLDETADVGVRTLLGVCEDEFGPIVGRTEDLELPWIGIGGGATTRIPALCCPWLSRRR